MQTERQEAPDPDDDDRTPPGDTRAQSSEGGFSEDSPDTGESPAPAEGAAPSPVPASSHWREMGTALLVLGGFVLMVGFSSGGLDPITAGWMGGALVVLGLGGRWMGRRSAAAHE